MNKKKILITKKVMFLSINSYLFKLIITNKMLEKSKII